MTIDINQIYCGDCLDIMKEMLKSNIQVDLTITSPPYDNLRKYNGSLNWSFEKFKLVAEYLYKITKDGGVVVWIVNDATDINS